MGTHRTILAALLFGGLCLQAQTTANTGTTTTDPATGVTTNNTATITPAAPSAAPGGQKPIFLSGIVMMDDGSPVEGVVNIQSICGATKRTMDHAAAGGTFGFQWSTTGAAFGDASQNVRGTAGAAGGGGNALTGSRNGSRGLDPLASCDLTAEAAGYTANRVSLYSRDGQNPYDVGTIVLHRVGENEGHTVSLLALKAPKDAKKNFDRGASLAAANKTAEAIASFEKAVSLYPDYADAWLSLGKAQWHGHDKDAARGSFGKAVALDAKLVGPWQELGFMACDEFKWAEAAHYLDQAVRLDPMDSANAWHFDSLANYNLGKFDLAERGVRAEIKLEPVRSPLADYLLGLILIARHDPEGAAAALRNYIASSPSSEGAATARRELSRLERGRGN